MKKALKFIGGALAVILLSVAGLLAWSSAHLKSRLAARYDIPPVDLTEEMKTADVELGKRIAHVRTGCTDCHGPDFAGSVFINDPVAGVIGGSNLTPAYLAKWSDGEIARAIHYGVGREGQPLVFMPAHELQHLSKGDVASLIAYLRTLPPSDKPRPDVKPGPMLRTLYGLGKMPTLVPAEMIDSKAPFTSKPQEAPTAEFGKYLITASCTGCHGAHLAGGPIPGGPPTWPPASDLRSKAIGGWTEAQFVQTMRTGVNPSGHALRPPMPVEMGKHLQDTELKAMWAYLKTQ